MIKYLTIVAIIALVGCSMAHTHEEFSTMVRKFNDYNNEYKKYHSSKSEFWYRFHAFVDNDKKITDHNSQTSSWKMQHNKFSDMYPSEFRYHMTGYKCPSNWQPNSDKFTTHTYSLDYVAPDAVDWRAQGLVTPIKDQGDCGSCWAFSSTGAMEGAFAKKNGTLISLSEQDLVDCVDDCSGCDGGWMAKAMEYVVEHGGIDTELSYPYQGVGGQCAFNQSNVATNFSSVVNITQGDCQGLFNAVATQGPISVAINANGIMNYQNGIYSDQNCDPQSLDHGVLVVGYGVTTDGKLYYIVKNSWGTDWGQDGYMYWDRSIDNMCGICEDASYPIAA